MYIEVVAPDVPELFEQLGTYWLNTMLVNSISPDPSVNALVFSYLRLVDGAVAEYRLGLQRINGYYSTHDGFAWKSAVRSIVHFEHCIPDAHRAIRCFKKLRGHPAVGHLASAVRQKWSFANDTVADPIRELRDAIQHLDSAIRKGELPPDSPIALKLDGTETVHPTEKDKVLKRLDSLVLGSHVLRLDAIAGSLAEMSNAALQIASAWRPTHELQASGEWPQHTQADEGVEKDSSHTPH